MSGSEVGLTLNELFSGVSLLQVVLQVVGSELLLEVKSCGLERSEVMLSVVSACT